MRVLLLAVALVLSPVVFSAPEGHQAPPMSAKFESLKRLVGTWEGTTVMGHEKQPVTVTYELTSGGTVIVARLMQGTPHEMVSVYTREGDSLGMTHYCSMGNHPHMSLKKISDNSFAFELAKQSGIASPKAPHMHAVTLTLKDANTLSEEWSHFNDGKQVGAVNFLLQRKK